MLRRIAAAALLLLSLAACSAPAPAAPQPSAPPPPPPASSSQAPDAAPVVRAMLTAQDAATLGFTSDTQPRAVSGPGLQLVGSCRDKLPSDAEIIQEQGKDWYTGDPLSVAVNLHQQTAQYPDGKAAQAVAELLAAGGCTAGTGSLTGTKQPQLAAAPGVDAQAAVCSEYEGPFAERNCVVVVAHGTLVTSATLDVQGNAAGEVKRKADAVFGKLGPLLAAAVTRA
ncbi:hypothetical protein [Amycolatopsis sacchari]|uniref:hypothetical protein n=1 Tax=Amycolatopsis sacchari TaxID=115433 RepID=UPI003D726298